MANPHETNSEYGPNNKNLIDEPGRIQCDVDGWEREQGC